MRVKELRERSDEELNELRLEAKNKLFECRVKNATHQPFDTSLLRQNRREVARITTLLKERAGQTPALKEEV